MDEAEFYPFAVTDIESTPVRVVARYREEDQAEQHIDSLRHHAGRAIGAKAERGGYAIRRNSRNRMAGKVAPAGLMDYTKGNAKPPRVTTPSIKRKATIMPPRGRRAAAAPVDPEPEVAEEAVVDENPFDRHLTKDLSPTMSDYGDWFHENVADITELGSQDPYRLLALGSTLYPQFQKSDLNQSRKAERAAARQAAAPEPEQEPEEVVAPARKGRPARAATSKVAAAAPVPAPARRGRPAAAAKAEAAY